MQEVMGEVSVSLQRNLSWRGRKTPIHQWNTLVSLAIRMTFDAAVHRYCSISILDSDGPSDQ